MMKPVSRSCCGDENCGKCLQHSGVEAWPDMGKLFDGVAQVALLANLKTFVFSYILGQVNFNS